jgi:hypothetical protein
MNISPNAADKWLQLLRIQAAPGLDLGTENYKFLSYPSVRIITIWATDSVVK